MYSVSRLLCLATVLLFTSFAGLGHEPPVEGSDLGSTGLGLRADAGSELRLSWDRMLFHPTGNEDGAGRVTLDSMGNRLYIASRAFRASEESSKIFALGATGGDLLDEIDMEFTADDIVARNHRVFVAGSTRAGFDWTTHLQAYDARSGAQVWTDEIDGFSPNISGPVLAADGGLVFLVVSTPGSPGDPDRVTMIRAYDQSSGQIDWEYLLPDADLALVATRGDAVYVTARKTADSIVLAALSQWSGELNWIEETAGHSPWSIATVPGLIALASGGVLAYAQDGTPAWADASPLTLAFADGGERLYSGGLAWKGPDPGPVLFNVRAHDSRSGERLWDYYHGADGESPYGVVRGIAARGSRVVAVGESIRFDTPSSPEDTLVVAYDGPSGIVRWTDRIENTSPFNSRVAIVGNKACVATVIDDDGAPGIRVRVLAYELSGH